MARIWETRIARTSLKRQGPLENITKAYWFLDAKDLSHFKLKYDNGILKVKTNIKQETTGLNTKEVSKGHSFAERWSRAGRVAER